LLRTTLANGLEENKGKWTSQKHPNSFPSSAKVRAGFFPLGVEMPTSRTDPLGALWITS
jgi:hypothetical protein